MIIDIILCAVLVAAFIIGYKRGLLRTLWGLAALVIAIALTGILRPCAVDMFASSSAADSLKSYVHTKVESSISTSGIDMAGSYDYPDMIGSAYTLPDTYARSAAQQLYEASENTVDTVTETITAQVISIASGVLLFILIRFLLAVLYRIIRLILKLPLLKQSNKLLGGAVQLVIALVIIYAVLAAAAVVGSDIAKDTMLCSHMYNNNLLLAVIGI